MQCEEWKPEKREPLGKWETVSSSMDSRAVVQIVGLQTWALERQKRDEIRFGLKEGQAAGAASSAGRPPPYSQAPFWPICPSLVIACFVTGRAKDACFPRRWLGNGQQGTARWPTTTPVLTPGRAPSRFIVHAAQTSAHRHKQKQGRPAIPALSDSSLHQDSKTALRLNFLLQTQSHHPVQRPRHPLSRWLAYWLPRSRPRIFLPSLPCTCAVRTYCSPIVGSPSMGQLPPRRSSNRPRVVSNPSPRTAPAQEA